MVEVPVRQDHGPHATLLLERQRAGKAPGIQRQHPVDKVRLHPSGSALQIVGAQNAKLHR